MNVYLDTADPTDKITKDNTLTIAGGTYETSPNSLVKIYANGSVIAQTTSNVKGVFSVTTPVLPDGVYVLRATVTPPRTNVESPFLELGTWTIDTIAPSVPVITKVVDDTGSSSSDRVTKDNTLVIVGTADANTTIKLYDNEKVIWSVELGGSTNFELRPRALPDGLHHLYVTSTDVAGNESPGVDLGTWLIDTKAPTLLIVSSASSDTGSSSGTSLGSSDRITHDDTITITGITEPKATVKIYDKITGSYVRVGIGKADNTGYYSVTTIVLLEGPHILSITATDIAGNTSKHQSLGVWVIDKTPPLKPELEEIIDDTGYSSLDSLTRDRTLTFVGTAQPESFIRVYNVVTGQRVLIGSGWSNKQGNFSVTTIPLDHGRYKFVLTATDKAGNTGQDKEVINSWSVDLSSPDEPSVSSTSSDTGSSSSDRITSDNTVTITGHAEPLSIIKIYSTYKLPKNKTTTFLAGHGRADGTGYYSVTTQQLSDGQHTLKITATDLAGNESKPTNLGLWIIDTKAPNRPTIRDIRSDTGYSSRDEITADTELRVRGTGTSNTIVKIYDYFFDPRKVVAIGRADARGDFDVTTIPLPNGVHPLYVVSRDTAGNESQPTFLGNWVIDTSSPSSPSSISFSSQAGFFYDLINKITDDKSLTLVGRAEPNALVRLYTLIGGLKRLVGTGFTDGQGKYSVTTEDLEDGTHPFVATTEDFAGNESQPVPVGTWTVRATKSETVAYNLCKLDRYAYVGNFLECSLCKAGWPQRSGRLNFSLYGPPCPYLSTGTETGINTNGWPSPSWFWGFESQDVRLSCIPTTEGKEYVSNVWVGRALRGGPAQLEVLVRFEMLNSNSAKIDMSFNVLLNGTWTPYFSLSTTLNKKPDPSCIGKACGTLFSSNYIAVSPSSVFCQGDLRYVKLTVGTSAWFEGCGPTPEALPGVERRPGPVCSFFNGNRLYTCFRVMAYSKETPPAFAPSFTQIGFDKDNCVYTESDYLTDQPTQGVMCDCLYGKKTGQNFSVKGSWIRHYFDIGCPGETDTAFQSVQLGTLGAEIPKEVETAPIQLGRWTIDTDPPEMPTVDGISRDTNSASSDRITKVNTLTIYGTGEPRATVYVYDTFEGFNQVVGKASIPVNGNFKVTTEVLEDGQHSLKIGVTDKAGNESDKQSLGIWTIDTEAPDMPEVEKVTDDTGNSSDRYTKDNTLTVRGTAEPNSLVRLYIYNTITKVFVVVGEKLVDPDGSYIITSTPLADNEYPLSITNIDIAGNESQRFSLGTWIIDTRPTIANIEVNDDTGSNSSDSVTKDNTLTITGSAEAGTTVRLYANGNLAGEKLVTVSGNYFITTDELADGTYILTATLTDSLGQVSPTTQLGTWVIDTVKPNKPTFSKISKDTGRVGDKVTKQNSLTVRGTTAPYNIIRIYDENSPTPAIPIAIAKADAQGKYTAVTPALTDGKHNLKMTSADLAGNQSEKRNLGEWTIDTANPEIPLVQEVTVDTGRSNTDKITNDNRITVAGTCEPGGVPKIYDSVSGDYELVGTGKSDGAGNYSVTTIPLEDGEHILSVAITDLSGNEGDYVSLGTWFVDTLAPSSPSVSLVEDDTWSLSSSNSSDRVTKDKTLRIKGKSEPNAIIKIYDNGILIKTTLADNQGYYDVTLDALEDGTHNLTVTATDIAGNESNATSLSDWIVDTRMPSSPSSYSISSDTGSSSEDRIGNDSTLTIIGEAEPFSLIRIYSKLSGVTKRVGKGYADSKGRYKVTTVPLQDGEHELYATSTDDAGNESKRTYLGNWVIDTQAPDDAEDLSLASDGGISESDGVTADKTITVTGTALPDGRVRLYKKVGNSYILLASSRVRPDGKFSITTQPLPDGVYNLYTTVTDKEGNESLPAFLRTWTIDTSSASSATVSSISSDTSLSSSDQVTSDNTLTITGRAEPLTLVKIFDLFTGLPDLVGEGYSDQHGYYSITTSELEDGIHELYVVVVDLAGNASSPVYLGIWVIDTKAPRRPSSSSASLDAGVHDKITTDKTITVVGRAEPKSLIKLKSNGFTVGVTKTTLAGYFSVTSRQLANGSHVLTLTSTDLAGNESVTLSLGTWQIVDILPQALGGPYVDVDTGRTLSESSDKITKDNTLTISGDGQIPGRTIKIYARLAEPSLGDPEYVGTDTVAGDGTYAATTIPLADGVYDIYMTFVDLVDGDSYEIAVKDVGDGSICVAIRKTTGNTWEVCSTPVIIKDYSPAILKSECLNLTIYLYAMKFPNPDILPMLCYSSSGSSEYCGSESFMCDGVCSYRYSALFDTWVLEDGDCVSRLGYSCTCTPPPDPATISPHPVNGELYETNCR